jgi:tetratricopeptide (TPR) repeat protein
MSAALELDNECLLTTDGEIALINLESARRRSWSSFFRDPLREGIAETVVEHEKLAAMFVGDLSAFDRLEYLFSHLAEADPGSKRAALIQAQVASMTHRFADARRILACADLAHVQPADVNRLRLTIDQACGANLDKVLDERRKAARKPGRIEDLVVLGALLADLREFADADRIYRHALQIYRDVSPFPVAWVYFQLGVLWGELIPEPQLARAEAWYRKAIDCLPSYTKARVHLAEICSFSGRPDEAEVLLVPAVASGDPEVLWRLADAMVVQKRHTEAEAQIGAARSGFESLLDRHLLAFADHGAEFYAGSGNNWRRALDLSRVNVANRPTLRALEQAHEIAVNAGDPEAASELIAEAESRWGSTAAFRSSQLAHRFLEKRQGAAT